MSKPKIYLYAEALTHIRQLTLYASLETAKNEHTKILLSSDKKVITAIHDEESSSIYLPTQISGTANVTFPTDKRTEISARLQIDDVDQLKPADDDAGSIEVPWSAGDLTTNTSVRCKSCGADILSAGKVTVWKDLPSTHWAELMDFWFCHKPHDDPSNEQHAAESKGFAPTSKFTASPGAGLVDTVSFLLHEKDCQNLKLFKHASRAGAYVVKCFGCGTTIGSSQENEDSRRLVKSRLQVVPDSNRDSESFPAATFVCGQLLSLIESSVTRRVVVHADNRAGTHVEEDEGLMLWIFNPDIYYSSSKRGPTAHRAMKVFYKVVANPVKFLDANSTTYEELVVTEEDFVDFRKTLEESTNILPQSARRFQDWEVGLLDRWEKTATGLAKMDENPLNKKVDEGFELFKLPAGMQELYM
ncbi:hypothetical protein HRR83_001198 [Exophiala dermatitidis]|uniref:Ubiquitin-conjugating enzyme E2C-binding protein n=2 Tax=Exophiala dermatitidis TaxID=5970 RepID=H6C728_EXODN|nr:uncharacterized protein HMPREF1120_07512 [Exophiala dermatitidis NIH/UT8656]KAJ4522708.1 hypothetical protein HRR75_001102 [Exophiala dermatitidis]EHY59524.1 hypothetical protein HMPREF1120_07512 [Exophiala dermatitidis NIH/UT8656]KAJ4526009.1 hypothetical protein HRR74_001202 [Exophiala dermatitidis]KAJ4527045.1 hypothetical protein HRR73_001842 [Exophiala dermatitidis]KAJ4532763.1 hypothetical protein HRR76_007744 [Exophiala dermatitidis]